MRVNVLSLILALLMAAGLASAQPPPADEARTCVSDCDCPTGTLCTPQGLCGAVACTRDWSPVCGLDGTTYANPCEMRSAHVALAHPGECKNVCMGIVGIKCPSGMFCELPTGQCGAINLQGVCQPRPEVCTYDYVPVCGCDGRTYSNDCQRRAHGVQKAGDGECEHSRAELMQGPDGPETCSAQDDCPEGAYCSFEPGACGKGQGVCLDIPFACYEIHDPVCACDGTTYSNDCLAAMNRQSVRRKGACKPRK